MTSSPRSRLPPPPVNDDAPPPPPVEDDEAPPPPPEEDDAPPPPPEDEELEAELLVQEYMAAQRKPRAAPAEVEAGFINAPEAKGKRPYATPEEAAVGEGVVPIKEEPGEERGVVSANYVKAVLRDLDKAQEAATAELVDACPEAAKPTKTRKARAKKADKAANFVADPETMAKVPVSLTGAALVAAMAECPPEPTVFTADREMELVNLPTTSEMTEEQCVKARAEFVGVLVTSDEVSQAYNEGYTDGRTVAAELVQQEMKAYFLELAKALVAVLEVKS